jgi:acyl-CoA dehydrogenase
MVDFALTTEQAAIRSTVRAFIRQELIPREQEILRRETEGGPGYLTRTEVGELRATARKSGLWGIDTPREYGGAELDAVTRALANEELGRTVIWFEFGGSVAPVLYAADDYQKARYLIPFLEDELTYCFALSEAEAGSDPAAMRTRAVRNGGDWVISGEKMWISRGDQSDVAVVFAKTEDDSGSTGISAFLVDREMGWKSSAIPVMGSQNIGSLSFPDVRVPARNLLGPLNGGLRLALQSINASRACNLPPRAVGSAQRLLSMAVEYANSRLTFGQRLAERQSIQWMIAESDMEIRSVQGLYLHAAWTIDQGRSARHEASAAKLAAARMANRVVDRVLQLHGAAGYARELPIERWYRDLRVTRIYEGSDEIQLAQMARALLSGHVGTDGLLGEGGA